MYIYKVHLKFSKIWQVYMLHTTNHIKAQDISITLDSFYQLVNLRCKGKYYPYLLYLLYLHFFL